MPRQRPANAQCPPLAVENEHASVHAPYCSFYTPETRELVRMHYARDIEELKYSFPET